MSLDRIINVSSARGESYADILRRTGLFGVLPTDDDAAAVGKVNADALASASTAEAAAGPTYASTAAGLAATSSGEAFAVDAGGGLVTVYLNSAGVAVPQRTLATTAYLGSSEGANAVGFQFRTLGDRARDIVNLKDEGAVAGGASIHTVLGAALDKLAARGGGILEIPPGSYNMTAAVSRTFADGVYIEIRANGAKITVSGVTSGAAIALGGGRASNTPLGADVSKNSDTFTVASATGIAAGRILLISSTDLWNPTRAYYYKGELSLVEEIAGTTITNSNPLYDGYAAATTTVHILNMPQVVVDGLEIECNADITGLQILYSRSPVVRKCKVHGSRYAGIYVGYCLGGTVDGNFVYDVWNGLVTGTSYGISIGSGQGIKAVNNTIHNARHAIASGGFEPLRNVIFANNTCSNSTLENLVGCLDLHGNVEFALVTGNIASSVNCAGINAVISNNILNSAESNVSGVLIYQEVNADYYIIKGNRVACAGSSAMGIWVSPTVAGLNIGKLQLEGNNIEAYFGAVRLQPRASGITGCSVETLMVQNNALKSTGTAALLCVNSGAATYSIGEIISSSNVYEALAQDAFGVIGNPVGRTTSIGDTFKANRSGGSVATFAGTDVRLIAPQFIGNTGGAGVSRSVYYDNTGRVDVVSPSYSGVTYKAELIGPTEYAENGWNAATPTIVNTVGARLVSFYGALGHAVAFGTAAPTTKTWAVGDRVYNQSPAVGQPKSWVCTVAGTPGTWVSEGNL